MGERRARARLTKLPPVRLLSACWRRNAEREWKAMEKNGEGKNNFWALGTGRQITQRD
jgi:hypothetical protein